MHLWLVDNNQKHIAKIEEGDIVLSYNFRTDRPKTNYSCIDARKILPEFEMSYDSFTLCKHDSIR